MPVEGCNILLELVVDKVAVEVGRRLFRKIDMIYLVLVRRHIEYEFNFPGMHAYILAFETEKLLIWPCCQLGNAKAHYIVCVELVHRTF